MTLTDSAGKTITTQHSDSLGRFTFESLANGQYHLMNKDYKLDTLFIIKGRSIDLFAIQLNVCEVDANQADWGIQHGKIRLLLAGGISPVYYHGQEVFEKKYHLRYEDYGCTPPKQTCMVAYDRAIFNYLDKQYGKRWRKEVRKDVVGYR
ncbi:FEKKY domain-containing protein [Mucilaginibacter sp.]